MMDAPSNAPSKQRAARSLRYSLVVVALVTAAVWLPSVRNGFVWDDQYDILRSDRLHHARAVVDVFAHHAMWSADQPEVAISTYRPLALATLAVDWQLWHTRPAGYHATNVLLHVLATLALFLALLRLVGDARAAAMLGPLVRAAPGECRGGRVDQRPLGDARARLRQPRDLGGVHAALHRARRRAPGRDARQGDRHRLRPRRRRARQRATDARALRRRTRRGRLRFLARVRPRPRHAAAARRVGARHARARLGAHDGRGARALATRAHRAVDVERLVDAAGTRRLGHRRRRARCRRARARRATAILVDGSPPSRSAGGSPRPRSSPPSPRSIIHGPASAAGSTSACPACSSSPRSPRALFRRARASRSPPSSPRCSSSPPSARSPPGTTTKRSTPPWSPRRPPTPGPGAPSARSACHNRATPTPPIAFTAPSRLDRTEEVHAAYALEAYAWARLGRCDAAVEQFRAHPVTPALRAEDFDAAAEACRARSAKALTPTDTPC